MNNFTMRLNQLGMAVIICQAIALLVMFGTIKSMQTIAEMNQTVNGHVQAQIEQANCTF